MQMADVWRPTKKKEKCIKVCLSEQIGDKRTVWKEDNQDVDGNKKLFWKDVSNVNGGKVESSNSILDSNGRLTLGEDMEDLGEDKKDMEGLF